MLEQSTEAFLANDLTGARRLAWRLDDQSVADALMRPLCVIVLRELVNQVVQMALSADQKAMQAFVLKRLNESFCARESMSC